MKSAMKRRIARPGSDFRSVAWPPWRNGSRHEPGLRRRWPRVATATRSPCSARMTARSAPSSPARAASSCWRATAGRSWAGWSRCIRPASSPGRSSRNVPYRLRIEWPGLPQETEDPYSFGLLLGELDLHLFAEGRHFELAKVLRRAGDDGRRRARRALRRLGAECAARLGGRRLQRLGRPAPSDAAARARRASGSCSSRACGRARPTSTRSSAPTARCCR